MVMHSCRLQFCCVPVPTCSKQILIAADWNVNRRSGAYGTAYGTKAVQTTFAGFILLAASNALLILSMGTEPSHAVTATSTNNNPVASEYAPAGGVHSTRNLGAASTVEGGNGQTVV